MVSQIISHCPQNIVDEWLVFGDPKICAWTHSGSGDMFCDFGQITKLSKSSFLIYKMVIILFEVITGYETYILACHFLAWCKQLQNISCYFIIVILRASPCFVKKGSILRLFSCLSQYLFFCLSNVSSF